MCFDSTESPIQQQHQKNRHNKIHHTPLSNACQYTCMYTNSQHIPKAFSFFILEKSTFGNPQHFTTNYQKRLPLESFKRCHKRVKASGSLCEQSDPDNKRQKLQVCANDSNTVCNRILELTATFALQFLTVTLQNTAIQ